MQNFKYITAKKISEAIGALVPDAGYFDGRRSIPVFPSLEAHAYGSPENCSGSCGKNGGF